MRPYIFQRLEANSAHGAERNLNKAGLLATTKINPSATNPQPTRNTKPLKFSRQYLTLWELQKIAVVKKSY